MKNKQPISKGPEWNFKLLEHYDDEIARIAKAYSLDTYPNQLEVISTQQMLEGYAASGMPINYNHWSFGKQYVSLENDYRRGHMNLAYEMVINSNPCISYLMEENTVTMQALVIAHACYGHNSFFKNNYLFQTWTQADAIIDYLLFAKKYIAKCEARYGIDAVEEILDACHALKHYGVYRYKHPAKLPVKKARQRRLDRDVYIQSQVNELWNTIPDKQSSTLANPHLSQLEEPEENLLYFVEKNSPDLADWEREIVRITRKIAQYFYPQRQTKIMNEGWATFWHYRLLHDLYDEGLVTDEFMMEFLQAHTNVIYQPGFDEAIYKGINPYTLGYNIYTDIRRICENPTDEDKQWFPQYVNTDWLKTIDFAMRNFKDESFIAQFLSPKVIRDMKLFALLDDETKPTLEITGIHNKEGYTIIRQVLAEQFNLGSIEPNIQVYNADFKGDRSLTLRYTQHNHRSLMTPDVGTVLKHIHRLWGFKIHLDTVDIDGRVMSTLSHPTPQ